MPEELFQGYKIRLNPTLDQQKLLFKFAAGTKLFVLIVTISALAKN